MEEIDEKSHQIIEGTAKIIFDEELSTFYNPIQEFNRDLT
jgi:tRNA G26 N,N-dimethylase Trm1